MTLLCVVLLILFLESLYCYRRRKKNIFSTCGNQKNNDQNKTTQEGSNRYKHRISTLFEDLTFFLFKIVGFIPCHIIRYYFYKYVFWMKLGEKVVIYYGLETRDPWNISIGNGSIIGDKCILDGRRGIVIGNNVNISTGVWIWTLQHQINSPSFETDTDAGIVEICDRAWISSRTTILPNCYIHEGCVIASGGVLTKSTCGPFKIYAGVPGKCIGERNSNLLYEFDGTHRKFL